jgi:hypothetical protein
MTNINQMTVCLDPEFQGAELLTCRVQRQLLRCELKTRYSALRPGAPDL